MHRELPALDTLLAYNVEDVVNLETLMVHAYNMKLRETPFAETHAIALPARPEVPFKADLATVTRIRDAAKYSFLDITITEGRNRQVRRMIEALDAKVLKLVRTAIGPIKIEDLEIGTYRELSEFELRTIRGAN